MDHRTCSAPQAVCMHLQQRQQQQQPQQQSTMLMAHTHSHTVVHSQLQQHTHRVTLMKHWVPGQGGAPQATLNTGALCDELNTRLLGMDHTLLSMLGAKQHSRPVAGGLEACRQQLESSLEKQLAFSTALLLDWCGATPTGSLEQVLQQLLKT